MYVYMYVCMNHHHHVYVCMHVIAYIALHDMTFHDITLHCIISHYIVLHYITSRYIILYYITKTKPRTPHNAYVCARQSECIYVRMYYGTAACCMCAPWCFLIVFLFLVDDSNAMWCNAKRNAVCSCLLNVANRYCFLIRAQDDIKRTVHWEEPHAV